MVFCPNCGADVSEAQKFCEKCGSSIAANVKSPSAEMPYIPESGREVYDQPGGLFDLNRNYYILKEN
ncbi:unnamed protein product [marine sediment metagenome]|uniref:Zinc-ribbon domain-containing protein n=1 Tax=marine sediment metagenome TaxID=412755 RepID=X1AA11_9ZZZZ